MKSEFYISNIYALEFYGIKKNNKHSSTEKKIYGKFVRLWLYVKLG